MPSQLDDLLDRLAHLERQVEEEVARAGEAWRYRIEAGRVRFDREVRQAHLRLRQGLPVFLRESNPISLLTAPVIYSMILPIGLLDLWISLYQRICFPVYGIDRVRRSAYIVVDRHHLAYLNGIEKLNCVYCGTQTGCSRTCARSPHVPSRYWCPIRHARRVRAPHAHYREFVDYGDAEGYHRRLPMLRKELKQDDGER